MLHDSWSNIFHENYLNSLRKFSKMRLKSIFLFLRNEIEIDNQKKQSRNCWFRIKMSQFQTDLSIMFYINLISWKVQEKLQNSDGVLKDKAQKCTFSETIKYGPSLKFEFWSFLVHNFSLLPFMTSSFWWHVNHIKSFVLSPYWASPDVQDHVGR